MISSMIFFIALITSLSAIGLTSGQPSPLRSLKTRILFFDSNAVTTFGTSIEEMYNYEESSSHIKILHPDRHKPIDVYYYHKWNSFTVVNQSACISSKEPPKEFDEFEYLKNYYKNEIGLVGPSALIISLYDDIMAFHNESMTYRNIECSSYKMTVDIGKKGKLESRILVSQNNLKRAKSKNIPKDIIRLDVDGIYTHEGYLRSIHHIFEYFEFDEMEREETKIPFKLPVAHGCSQVYENITLATTGSPFSTYIRSNNLPGDSFFFAYDSKSNLMRKNIIDKSQAVYDLTECLVYFKPENQSAFFDPSLTLENLGTDICSIVNLEYYPDISSRNYIRGSSEHFLGIAGNLTYLGEEVIRGIPVLVLESQLWGGIPPIVTVINGFPPNWALCDRDTEMFMTIYMASNSIISKNELNDHPLDLKLLGSIPIRQQLACVHRGILKKIMVEELDFFDFRWSLDSMAIFDVDNCFQPSPSDIALEFVMSSDAYKGEQPSLNLNKFVSSYRYHFESEVLNYLAKSFYIARSHLYDLKFEIVGEKAVINVNIINRTDITIFYEYRERLAPFDIIKDKNSIMLKRTTRSVEECLMVASFIKDVKSVLVKDNICIMIDKEVDGTEPSDPKAGWSQFLRSYGRDSIGSDNSQKRFEYLLGKVNDTTLLNDMVILTNDNENRKMCKSKLIPSSMVLRKDPFKFKDIERVLIGYKIVSTSDNSIELNGENSGRVIMSSNDTRISFADCYKSCQEHDDCHSFTYCHGSDIKCHLTTIYPRLANENDVISYSSATAMEITHQKLFEQLNRDLKDKLIEDSKCEIHQRNYLNLYEASMVYLPTLEGYKHLTGAFSINDCAYACYESAKCNQFIFCQTNNVCGQKDTDYNYTINNIGEFKLSALEDQIKHIDIASYTFKDQYKQNCFIYKMKYLGYFTYRQNVTKDDRGSIIMKIPSTEFEFCAEECIFQTDGLCQSIDICSNASSMTLGCYIREAPKNKTLEGQQYTQDGKYANVVNDENINFENELNTGLCLNYKLIPRRFLVSNKRNNLINTNFCGFEPFTLAHMTVMTIAFVLGIIIQQYLVAFRVSKFIDAFRIRDSSSCSHIRFEQGVEDLGPQPDLIDIGRP